MQRLKTLEQYAGHALLPTNVAGAYSIPLLKPDFDPHAAGRGELRRHGFPWLRPDAQTSPPARKAWAGAFGPGWRPSGQIVPHLAVVPGAAPVGKRPGGAWSGVVVRDPFGRAGGGNAGVTGQWRVPTVARPANDRAPGPVLGFGGREPPLAGWDSSSWIGIDGGAPGAADVLQAGVQHYVAAATGRAAYLAWFEWYVPQPDPNDPAYVHPMAIANFDVHPGDALSCNVSYVDRQYGTVSLGNLSTGAWFSMALMKPLKASFGARSIEWILESPGGGPPDFGPVAFTSAFACGGATGELVGPQSGSSLVLSGGAALAGTAVDVGEFALTISQA